MELVKRRSEKEEYKSFYDLYLKWTYQGKEYMLLIRPVFYNQVKPLLAHAKEIE